MSIQIYPVAPPSAYILGGDHSHLVTIFSHVLVLMTAIVVIARAVARHRVTRVVEAADILLPLALAVGIAQSVIARWSVDGGIGRHQDSLTAAAVDRYHKLFYIDQILNCLVLGLSKTTVALLLKGVEPQKPVLIGCNALLAGIAIWTTISVLAIAFQCHLPNPWDLRSSTCLDVSALYFSINIISIITDLVLVTLPIAMMCMLQTSREKRVFVCGLFSTRIIVPFFTIPQLYYLNIYLTSSDQTWHGANLQIWTLIVLNFSIITACIPSLGRIMAELALTLTSSNNSEDVESGRGSHSSSLALKHSIHINKEVIVHVREVSEDEDVNDHYTRDTRPDSSRSWFSPRFTDSPPSEWATHSKEDLLIMPAKPPPAFGVGMF